MMSVKCELSEHTDSNADNVRKVKGLALKKGKNGIRIRSRITRSAFQQGTIKVYQ